ncbi:alpha-1,3-mannosyltransferase CMT1 [Sarocladium strictum]
MYRDRRTLLIIVPVLAFLLITTSIYLSGGYITQAVFPKLRLPTTNGTAAELSGARAKTEAETTIVFSPTLSTSNEPSPTPVASTPVIPNGTILQGSDIGKYLNAILDPSSTAFDRLQCPTLNRTRYAPLQPLLDEYSSANDQLDYFFALNLRNNLALLPRLIGSILEAIEYLDPAQCALSIVEGNSPDGTADVLGALKPFLDDLDIPYFFSSSKVDPKKGDRIAKLAELRNLALEPLFNSLQGRAHSNTTVLFLNDVAICAEDILELALQRRNLGADMTCAMDWTYVGPDPTFYDVWVARGINGDSFFEVPKDGNWNSAWNLFWNDATTKARLMSRQPFQVYSCWNGAVTFSAAPLLNGLRFRKAQKGHCSHGEPQIFCKDLWLKGYGKIAVVPSVNLEYSDEAATKIKKLKGYVSEYTQKESVDKAVIEWAGPPEKVKCIEGWGHQFWKPWKISRREFVSNWKN